MWGISRVPWGMFSTVKGYLEYHGVFSTVGDSMSTVGDRMSTGTVGETQYHGDIMMHLRDIMSTVGDIFLHNFKARAWFSLISS